MTWNAPRSTTLLVALTLTVLTGCDRLEGLSFVQDDRVHIVTPDANEGVEQPVSVRWTATDVDAIYALFFDRAPMRPGQELLSLVPEHDACRTEPVCPTAAWLAERNIYLTDRTSLTVAALPDLRNNNRSKDRHDLVIVLLDRTGKRIGESAFYREFLIERKK